MEQQTSKQGQNKINTENDNSIDNLELLFDWEDWQELYAFADLIDSVHGTEQYDSGWEEWAKTQGDKTAEQWRQYFEKVVRPQWLRDPEWKRAKIKTQVEKKHDSEENVSQSQQITEAFSQTSGLGAEALGPQLDERFEDLIDDKSNKGGIPAGYKFYAREKKQETLDAQPGRGVSECL